MLYSKNHITSKKELSAILNYTTFLRINLHYLEYHDSTTN